MTINKLPKGLTVKNAKDSQIAFENAKSKGLNKPDEYMYMYSKDNKDFFKNINFRNYISFNQ
jgi:retron-type reverse transcriptase